MVANGQFSRCASTAPAHSRHDIDIPEGIGRTAMYMSLIRHQESRRADALFHDPFAEVVSAALAGTPTMEQLAAAHGATSTSFAEKLDSADFAYFPVRTRYFDDRLVAAMRGGIRQVVSLAAGLDGRPMRLDCPPGTYWYELDLPDVTMFKKTLLEQSTLSPTCVWKGISADLTADWSSPLLAGGFNPAQPTIWLLEGLLMYLATEICDQLLASATVLSVPGSELLCEQLRAAMLAERNGTIQDGVKAQGISFASACDDLQPWLARYGWQATVHAGSDPAIGYNRNVPEMPSGWLAHAVLPPTE